MKCTASVQSSFIENVTVPSEPPLPRVPRFRVTYSLKIVRSPFLHFLSPLSPFVPSSLAFRSSQVPRNVSVYLSIAITPGISRCNAGKLQSPAALETANAHGARVVSESRAPSSQLFRFFPGCRCFFACLGVTRKSMAHIAELAA